jgi:hypothetical protein
MQRLRGMLVHSPSLAISVLALVFALGSGAGYAASTAPAGSDGKAPVKFVSLKLLPGWRGHVEYAVDRGIVYLDGLVHNTNRNEPILTKLPRSVAPRGQLGIPVTFGSSDGYVEVFSNGGMTLIVPKSDKTGIASLSGVSFVVGAPG